MKRVITYGTYDLLHIGHLYLLQRARELGDYLIVGVATDEFNREKGKEAICSYRERSALVAGLRCVDLVIPEERWEQKAHDIEEHDVGVFAMGDDWQGKFDALLGGKCEIVYLPRTPGIATSQRIQGIVTQRIAARQTAQLPCRLRVGEAEMDATTIDVSFAGSRLRIEAPFSPSGLDVNTAAILLLGEGPVLEVPALIVRIEDHEIAIQHGNLPTEARHALAVFLVSQSYDREGLKQPT